MPYTQDPSKRLFDLTVGEFIELQKGISVPQIENTKDISENLVYGLDGLAKLFNCTKQTAFKIKKSGKIDAAISQCGRVIVCRADLALELAGKKSGGRK